MARRRHFSTSRLARSFTRSRPGVVVALLITSAIATGPFVWLSQSHRVAMTQTAVAVEADMVGRAYAVTPVDDTRIDHEGCLDVRVVDAVVRSGDGAALATGQLVDANTSASDSLRPVGARDSHGVTIDGRQPRQPGEAIVSESVADSLDLVVGDPIDLTERETSRTLHATVVGVQATPLEPRAPVIRAVVDDLGADPTLCLTDDAQWVDQLTTGSVTSARFRTMVEQEKLDEGRLGIARRLTPIVMALAALVLVIAFRGWNHALANERRALEASGLSQAEARRWSNRLGGLVITAGSVLGALVAIGGIAALPGVFSVPWGMRWVTGVAVPSIPVIVVAAAMAAVVRGAAAVVHRAVTRSRGAAARKPFADIVNRIGLAVVAIALLFFVYPRTRATYGTNVILALIGGTVATVALPVWASSSRPSGRSRVTSRAEARRLRARFPVMMFTAGVCFALTLLSSFSSNTIDEQRFYYQPAAPLDSIAIRELSSQQQLDAVADATSLPSMGFRSLDGGLVAVAPSSTPCFEASGGYLDTAVDECRFGTLRETEASVVQASEPWTDTQRRPEAGRLLVPPDLVEDGQVALFSVGADDVSLVGNVAAEAYDRLDRSLDFRVAVMHPDDVSRVASAGQPTDFYYYAGFGLHTLSDAERARAVASITNLAPAAFFFLEDGYQDGGAFLAVQLIALLGAAVVISLLWLVESQLWVDEVSLWRAVRDAGVRSIRQPLLLRLYAIPSLVVSGAALLGWRTAIESGVQGARYGYAPWFLVVGSLLLAGALFWHRTRDTARTASRQA